MKLKRFIGVFLAAILTAVSVNVVNLSAEETKNTIKTPEDFGLDIYEENIKSPTWDTSEETAESIAETHLTNISSDTTKTIISADLSEDGLCGDSVTYHYEDGILTISGTGDMTSYSSYITAKSRPWYDFENEITTVIIENGVTNIGSWSFYCCENLKSVTISSTVTSIGVSAFDACYALESITIPSGVITIGGSAFECCSALTDISIASTVTSIGSMAFYGCSALTNITIPSKVTFIGSHAFSECSNLSSITILGGITSISVDTFYSCTSLESISVPDGVISIEKGAFYKCSSLKSITIPNSVTYIDSYAFYGCGSLSNISIPDGVTAIYEYTFYNCNSFTSITIPDSVTSIEKYAFGNCNSLASITIPDSVTSIGSSAFSGNCFKTAGPLGGGYDYEFGWTETIPAHAFSNCNNLTNIVIPESITSIGSYAFSICSSLTSITIPDGVTSIDSYTFVSCKNLTNITIPDSVTSIGECAFMDCYALTSIFIPSATTFGSTAFSGCSKSNFVIYVIENSKGESCAKNSAQFTGFSYVSLPELKVESADYSTNISDTLENGQNLTIPVKFNDDFNVVGGDISVLNEDGEEVFKIYGNSENMDDSDLICEYEKSETEEKTLTITIKSFSQETEQFSSNLGLYYYYNTLLTDEKLTFVIDDTVIEPVDPLTCEDGVYSGTYFGKQTLNIDLDDYNLDYPKDILNWPNEQKYFNSDNNNHYWISDELAGRINTGIIKSGLISKLRYVDEWGGSCFGMSALISLVKNELFDIDTIANGASEINELPCPRTSASIGGVKDWVNYLQLLQNDKNYSDTEEEVYMIDSPGEYWQAKKLEGGGYSSESKIKTVLQTIVKNAKDGKTTYTFNFGRLETVKKENDEEYVIYGHTMLPFGYYYNEDTEEHKILCYEPSSNNMYSIVTINSDFTDFTVSGYKDANIIRVGYTDLTKFNSQFDLSAMETSEASSVSLSSSNTSSEDNILWLQSIGNFKISEGDKCLSYDNGIFSGYYDIVEDFDIISSDSDSASMLKITLADAECYTVSTETGNLDCTLSTADMFGFSVANGSNLSVEFDCTNNTVTTEGNITEYTNGLAYDDENTVFINGSNETKVVMAKDDVMTVSTESGGSVDVDFIADGVYEKSETANSSNGITIINNGSELEIENGSEDNPAVYGLAGDVDNNNVLTANDAACLLHYVLNNEDLNSDWNLTKADVNGDDSLSAADAALILAKVLNSS